MCDYCNQITILIECHLILFGSHINSNFIGSNSLYNNFDNDKENLNEVRSIVLKADKNFEINKKSKVGPNKEGNFGNK